MKLKDGFILQDIGDEHMVVAAGEAGEVFNGLIRNNGTADFIFRELMTETDEKSIVTHMVERYDAPREVIARDVHTIVEKLRAANLLNG